MTVLTASDVLLGAIDVIHERGWCQSTLQSYDGRVCLVGALYLAAGAELVRNPGSVDDFDIRWTSKPNRSEREAAFLSATRAVEKHLNNDIGGQTRPAVWNDRVATSADEVIEVLKLANDTVTTGEST